MGILSEIVQSGKRASIVAWLSACEDSSGALFGAPVVGLLAEKVFGYRRVDASLLSGAQVAAVHSNNRHALSRAMLCGTVPPFLLCISLYSLLHWTYERDVRRCHGIPEAPRDKSTGSRPEPSELGAGAA